MSPTTSSAILSTMTADLDHLFEDDPVRPDLGADFRRSVGECFFLHNNDEPHAVVCVAFCSDVPKSVRGLSVFSAGGPRTVAVPYSVWSYKKGAGRDIIFRLLNLVTVTRPGIKRVVTLSPKTEMARNFHLSNGAFLFRNNTASDNYEYTIHGRDNPVPDARTRDGDESP